MGACRGQTQGQIRLSGSRGSRGLCSREETESKEENVSCWQLVHATKDPEGWQRAPGGGCLTKRPEGVRKGATERPRPLSVGRSGTPHIWGRGAAWLGPRTETTGFARTRLRRGACEARSPRLHRAGAELRGGPWRALRKVARPSDVPRGTISLAAGWGHEWTLAVALGGWWRRGRMAPCTRGQR